MCKKFVQSECKQRGEARNLERCVMCYPLWRRDAPRKHFISYHRRLIVRDQPGEQIDRAEATKRLTARTASSGAYLSRFLFGLLLMQIVQLLITYKTTWEPIQTTVFFAMIGFSVGCGMAFSKSIRAIATLVIPVMCTSSGRLISHPVTEQESMSLTFHLYRAVLMSYTSMMVLAGPVSNIAYNYGEISRSMMCGNELGFNITQGLQPMIQEKKFQFLDTLDNTIDVILSAVEVWSEIIDLHAIYRCLHV